MSRERERGAKEMSHQSHRRILPGARLPIKSSFAFPLDPDNPAAPLFNQACSPPKWRPSDSFTICEG